MLLFYFLIPLSIANEFPIAPKHENQFQNYERGPQKGFYDLLKWKLTESSKPWPEWIEEPKGKTPSQKEEKKLSITFINHASFLIQLEGMNIITDPIWSERTSPVSWAGPQRVREPGLKFNQVPKIDIILISHNHYDHLDLTTLKMIELRDSPTILAGKNTCKLLQSEGSMNCREYDWWQFELFKNLKITFVPAKHFSGRGLFDRNEVLWGGFVIESPNYGPIYFAGDTGYGKFIDMLVKKFQRFQISLLPIGAYMPRWFMKAVHMNPQEALKAHIKLNSKQSIGMHFGTFQLTDEAIYEPEEELKKALKSEGLNEKLFIVPKFGETFTF